MGSLIKIIALCLLPIAACQYRVDIQEQPLQAQTEETHEILDIESPDFFTFTPSPLKKPESLQSRPYFDFLSTLYSHDKDKSSLFAQPPKVRRQSTFNGQRTNAFNGQLIRNVNNNYRRQRREVIPSLNILDALQNEVVKTSKNNIQKRAIVFRPLFVYRQQQIEKQTIQEAQKYRRY